VIVSAIGKSCIFGNRRLVLRVFDFRILLSAGIGASISAPCYYLIGRAANTGASLSELYFRTMIFVVALLAGYELFFVVQRLNFNRKPYIVRSRLDDRIPFAVRWVWVYSVAYYALLGLPLSFLSQLSQCLVCIAGGFFILLLSSIVYVRWPTRCPPEWRSYPIEGASSRLLAFIQKLDNGRNCCPSLHCSFAAYTASLVPSSVLLIAIPALICLSCLFVKQHSVIDLPPSVLFGFVAGAIVNHLI
jgi:hypothetical protein